MTVSDEHQKDSFRGHVASMWLEREVEVRAYYLPGFFIPSEITLKGLPAPGTLGRVTDR